MLSEPSIYDSSEQQFTAMPMEINIVSIDIDIVSIMRYNVVKRCGARKQQLHCANESNIHRITIEMTAAG